MFFIAAETPTTLGEQLLVVVNALGGIAAFITAIVTLFVLRSQKKKNEADAALTITEAANNLIEPLKQQIEALNKDRDKDKQTICELEKKINSILNENETQKARITTLEALNTRLVEALKISLQFRRGLSCDPDKCLESDAALEAALKEVQEQMAQPVIAVQHPRRRKNDRPAS